MALDDILKTIAEQADKETAHIQRTAQARIDEINDAYARKLEARTALIVGVAKKRAEQKIKQTEFGLQSQSQAEILRQKKKMLDRVRKKTLEQLSHLDDTAYQELMVALIKELPNTGELISVNGKENLLKKSLKESGKKLALAKETIPGSGGFIFGSDTVAIDQTFPTLVQEAYEYSILKLADYLFKQANQQS